MTVTENVLSAEEHLKLGVLAVILDGTKSYPRILLEESEAGIEGSAAPSLKRMVTNLIHIIEDRNHLFGGHSGRCKRLMSITENSLCYKNFLFVSRSFIQCFFILS